MPIMWRVEGIAETGDELDYVAVFSSLDANWSKAQAQAYLAICKESLKWIKEAQEQGIGF